MDPLLLKITRLEEEEELILQHVIIPEDEKLCMKMCEMRKQAEEAENKALAEETNIPQIPPNIQLACGSNHTAIIATDGNLWTFGMGVHGQLGHGRANNEFLPRKVESLTNDKIKSVSCGTHHTAVIVADENQRGNLWTFGMGLGFGRVRTELRPYKIEGMVNAVSVACGAHHTAVITEDQHLWTFGCGGTGQLGHGETQSELRPRKVEAFHNGTVVSVACGSYHTAVITVDENQRGSLWTFGLGTSGQLGLGLGHTHIQLPRKVEALTNIKVVSVACGHTHTAVIVEDGSLWTFGDGYNGLGRTGNEFLPCKVEGLPAVTSVACGSAHTAVIGEDGSLWTFGSGGYGQLGHGNTENKLLPCKVQTLPAKKVELIACGGAHTAVILEDGSLWTFGDGYDGQLGIGPMDYTKKRLLPRMVKQL